MPRLRLLAALLASSQLVLPARKPVTIEAVVSARRVTDTPASLAWAPDGKRFVYLEDGSVRLYEIPGRGERVLVSTEALRAAAVKGPPPGTFTWQNRGVREARLQWAPSGDWILASEGGDLFRIEVESGKWRQLTNTAGAERDPKLSPDGRRVSFRRGHDLYALEIDSGQLMRLTTDGSATLLNGELDWVYPEELDLGTAHWWSPDSRHIAYLQFDVSREPLYPHADLLGPRPTYEPQRYPKAGDPNAEVRVGVVPAEGGATRWMDLGDARDSLIARLRWQPDSQAVWVQRLNRVQNRLDLVAAGIAGGAARLILRETDAAWVNVADDLRFLKSTNQFLWSSERDGFRHLYLYSMDGKQTTRLTKGGWETAGVAAVDEAARQVFYLSTEHSPLERNLYRIDFRGRGRKRLTAAAGVRSISMGPTAEYYLDSWSSLTEPPRTTVHSRDGAERAVLRPPDRKPLDEYEIRPTEMVEVKAQDGALLYARLVKPAGFDPNRKYPAVVMVYGGPHTQTVRNAWPGLTIDQALAHRGFVVWQLDNRGSAGRGHRWESALYRRLGARELEDQVRGVEHLVSMGFVDPRRVGIHGSSYGGYMTLYALLHAPGTFRAGVSHAPVTDWRLYDTIYTERYLGLPAENEEGYRLSSLVHFADRLEGKLLLTHNLEDDNVHFQNSVQMMDALERAGKQFETRLYPLKTHGVTGLARRHMLEALAAFFEEHLKK